MNDDTSDKDTKKVSPKVVRHKAPATEKRGARKDRNGSDKKPEFNSVVHPKEPKTGTLNKSISRSSAVLLALLSTLVGGAIGWVGPALFKSTDPTPDLQISINQLQTQLASQETNMGQLQTLLDTNNKANLAQQAKLFETVKAVQDSANETAPVDSEALQELFGSTIEGLETELAALKPQIDTVNADLNTRMDVLETSLTKDGAELGDGTASQAILERFTKLEAAQAGHVDLSEQFTDLQTQIDQLAASLALAPAFPDPATDTIDVPAVENLYDSAAALQALIDSFPRAKMLEAVHAQDVIAHKKPSWLQRTLSRHVKVRDDNAPTPLRTIDAAQSALANGDIHEAIAHIAKLNPPVRAIAAEWVSAAKKTAKAIDANTMNKGQ